MQGSAGGWGDAVLCMFPCIIYFAGVSVEEKQHEVCVIINPWGSACSSLQGGNQAMNQL